MAVRDSFIRTSCKDYENICECVKLIPAFTFSKAVIWVRLKCFLGDSERSNAHKIHQKEKIKHHKSTHTKKENSQNITVT